MLIVRGGAAWILSDAASLHLETSPPWSLHLETSLPGTKGYFLDHDNFAHTTGFPGGPNSPQWAKP